MANKSIIRNNLKVELQTHIPLIFLLLILANLCFPSQAEVATGIVYADTNRNGMREADEKGIPNILVTNQREFVKTDTNGSYTLEIDSDDILMVVKPADHDLLTNNLWLPQFYYLHKPNGSPNFLPPPSSGMINGLIDNLTREKSRTDRYSGVEPTGPLPASVDFPLYPCEPRKKFSVLVTSDPQVEDPTELDYVRRDVVSEMLTEPAVRETLFGVALGDIMSDYLEFYEPYNQVMATLKKPLFNIIGNHDINFDGPTDEYSDETWHRVYGPQYYAFFEGEALFVALDDIHWHHKSPEETAANKPSKEKGSWDPLFGKEQLQWLEKLLVFQPKERLLVLMMHVPLEVGGKAYIQDLPDLYRLLEGRKVLALCGHMHFQENLFIGEPSGYKGDPPIHEITHATVCGGWWNGIRDERGIPIALCIDGTDNGYSILTIDGSSYLATYKAAGKPWSYQMRIASPQGKVKAGDPIVVNIFAGSDRSQVHFILDEGSPVPMTRTVMPDPFTTFLWENRDKNLKNPAVTPVKEVYHLWTGKLPDDLKPGIHSLLIRELDQYGIGHEAGTIFEVE